jgi:hypothetical protein
MLHLLGTEGSVYGVVMTVLVLGGSAALERLAVARRLRVWFRLAMPLTVGLVPLVELPEAASGAAGGVRWERQEDGTILWWAKRSGGVAIGLHGVVYCVRTRRGVHLNVHWAPPLTGGVAACWVALIGAARHEAYLSGPLAAMLLGAILLGYHRSALQAARVLRWALADPRAGVRVTNER